ncbi:MAG: Cna B-type domain-containing protein, partial [Enterococcus sp.]|uniref:Cna B-type domain-containing protein n=1 Tax=Enterococcus sp. TaxID=35783 RepID=UPI0039946F54
LLQNGVLLKSIHVSKENSWAYEFKNLSRYKDGELVEYSITEDNVLGYTTEIDGFDITNSHVIRKRDIKASKVWSDSDDQDGIRPNGVLVQLYADGVKVGDPVMLNEANNWKTIWKDLNTNSAGKRIVYSVEEIKDVDGYESIVQEDCYEIS